MASEDNEGIAATLRQSVRPVLHLKAKSMTTIASFCLSVLWSSLASTGQTRAEEWSPKNVSTLLAQPRHGIIRLSLEYDHDTTDQEGHPMFFSNRLAWDLETSKYFWRRDLFADPERSKLQEVVVRCWDGKIEYFWSRRVRVDRPGLGLFNGEPVDPGTLVKTAKYVESPVLPFVYALNPGSVFGSPLDFSDTSISVQPSKEPALPGDLITCSKSKYWSISTFSSGGWLSKRDFHGAGVHEVLTLSDFVTVPGSKAAFPGTITRTMALPSTKPATESFHIKAESLRLNDSVTLPGLYLPPNVHVQDEVTPVPGQ